MEAWDMAEPPSGQRKRAGLFLVATIIAGLLAVLVGLFFFLDRPLNGISVEVLEADLNKRLPDGSTCEQAEAWFASHGIRPLEIMDENGRRCGLMTIIPNSSRIVQAEVRIFMYFNSDDRLRERIIYRFEYAL
jgi:hypothetical protein